MCFPRIYGYVVKRCSGDICLDERCSNAADYVNLDGLRLCRYRRYMNALPHDEVDLISLFLIGEPYLLQTTVVISSGPFSGPKKKRFYASHKNLIII